MDNNWNYISHFIWNANVLVCDFFLLSSKRHIYSIFFIEEYIKIDLIFIVTWLVINHVRRKNTFHNNIKISCILFYLFRHMSTSYLYLEEASSVDLSSFSISFVFLDTS